ncbi:MAG: hypothetical protein JNM91_15535, partial [Flavobacteriales bacterium]|nr:hypothetical protein [Flavobacteriales bacterium]
ISVSGTFAVESCCDFLRIVDGAGTGGAVLAQNVGAAGTISYTGAPGQTLTVWFTSDVSLQDAGFNLTVTYSGSCAVLCAQPTATTVSSIGTTSADVSWTCAGCTGPYIVEYGPQGFTPGTGATAGVGGTIWTGAPVAGSPVTITGLAPASGYSVYVRQECNPGVLYSVNNPATNFATNCATSTCTYIARIGDIWGDGWNGNVWQVRQNGLTIATLGLASGCGPVDVPITVCEGASLELAWTTLGSFTDEVALQFYDPFGVLLYDHRGTSTSANCPGVTWTSANNAASLGVKYAGPASCTPPACAQPSAVSSANVTANAADVSWTCAACTGTFYVEYGAPGFTPGTGASAGTGTLVPGGPFVAAPVTISGLSSSSTYAFAVRQECSPGVFSLNTIGTFTTGLDCATAPLLACNTPATANLAAGTGQWNLGNPAFGCVGGTNIGPFCTNGREQVWQFTAPFAGTYVLNTTATNGQWIDWFFKAAPSVCDPTGWTYIDDVISAQTFNFNIATPGTYYLLADAEGTALATQTFSIVCPLPCATPQAPFASNVSSVGAQINWTCTGCTGNQFIVEYGLNGF